MRISIDVTTGEVVALPDLPATESPTISTILVVTPRQIRQALTALGLRELVEQAISTSEQDVKDWWEFASSFEENHPQVIAMAQALLVSDEQLHALFVKAASL